MAKLCLTVTLFVICLLTGWSAWSLFLLLALPAIIWASEQRCTCTDKRSAAAASARSKTDSELCREFRIRIEKAQRDPWQRYR